DGETAIRESFAAMNPPDRALAKEVDKLIRATVPELMPKSWYGMPAYTKDGKVIVYFRNAGKFKERYSMLGFNETSNLDDGAVWPVGYALPKLTPADEKKIATLLRKAVR